MPINKATVHFIQAGMAFSLLRSYALVITALLRSESWVLSTATSGPLLLAR
jgi:hypothetical protein